MRRYLVAAGSFAVLLASATGVASASEGESAGHGSDGAPVVVASGLDNPRQLSWLDGSLLIAEAGEGGDDCAAPAPPAPEGGTTGTGGDTGTGTDAGTGTGTGTEPGDDNGIDPGTDPATGLEPGDDNGIDPGTDPATGLEPGDDNGIDPGTATGDLPTSDTDDDGACDGFTGRISAVDDPMHADGAETETLVDGLYSIETPLGAVGADGVAPTLVPGVLLIAEGEPAGDALAAPGVETDDPAAETQEHLLLSVDGEVFPWVDLGAEEQSKNPDEKAGLDSNPNGVIVVDPTPRGKPGVDEYALVADAGANTVWKVTPDFRHLDDNELPRPEVSVFARYEADDDPATPEFVPSALDVDRKGNVYVGGVGSLSPGQAEVVRYSAKGKETARWSGFTGINGLAVDRNGEHVYVSQILGDDADLADPTGGDVVRLDTKDETWTSVDVPRPSGLTLGGKDTVFVSAFSTSPADPDGSPETADGGQVWRFTFPEHVQEQNLPVTGSSETPEDSPEGEPAP